MGTITQTAPMSDTVSAGLNETYQNQLQSTGGVGVLTWSTTSPSTDLIVSVSGTIIATGSLLVGAYFIEGTVVDLHGNSGTWSFALTVVGPFSPGTGVTPVQQVLPSGVEVAVPFQIDSATGGIAFLSNYGAILAQHIETIIMTNVNERLMNPQYGYGLEQKVFTPINASIPNTMQSDIIKAIQTYESAVTNLSVTVTPGNEPNVLIVTVDFSIAPSNDLNTVTVTAGGTIAQVNPT